MQLTYTIVASNPTPDLGLRMTTHMFHVHINYAYYHYNYLNSMEQVNSLREIQALRRLNPHPNIIALTEVIL